MAKRISAVIIGLICLMSLQKSPAEAEVLYSDKHGVRVTYHIADTGVHTYCSLSPQKDLNYTNKKIKIWKVSLRITNGSGRKIKPGGAWIAYINVEPDRGSTLGYCFYNWVGDLHKTDGQSEQSKFMFSIASGVYAIWPGRTLSNSSYLYLYEDQKPALTGWRFSGYEFLREKKKTPRTQQSAKQAKTRFQDAKTRKRQTGKAAKRNWPTTRPRRGLAGSLILLIDISGSMKGAKLKSAKLAAVDTIRKAIKSNTEVAVIAFEGNCSNPIDGSTGFTRDETRLVSFVNGLSAKGKTPLATAIEATNRFMKRNKSATSSTQMVLLLADGEDDCGGLDEVLRKLKQNNLLYRHETVGLEASASAQKQLQSIAAQSGGNYHNATSQNLSKVFGDVVDSNAGDLMKMLDMLGKFK